ncbi:MAG: hypothetical protein WCP12_06980 [bacterium]
MKADGYRLLAMPNKKRTSARLLLGALFMCVALIPICLFADVFWRFKKNHSRLLQELGGTQVYSTAVQVNGEPGMLYTYAFEEKSATEIGAQLRNRFLIAKEISPSVGTMITSKENGRMQRLIVIPSGYETASSIVMLFEQSLQEGKKRSADEPLAWPEGLSALPGVPRFTAFCSATRTSFVTAETSHEPEDAMKSVGVALRDSGWSALPVASPTFSLFVRGTKTCIAFATHPAGIAQTTLSVMQREGAGK